MYGVFHAGGTRRSPTVGVLLCSPFGQEAVRTHRMYRVLAERLSRAGLHVLRFDYHATGESAGDDEDGDLDGWCSDVVTAHGELLHRATCSRVAWLGTRLGGTLAALASARAARAPDRLVLWEPIADGRAYREELARSHGKALANSYSIVPTELTVTPTSEAIGFATSATLVAQLNALDEARLAGARAAEVVLIANRDASQCERLKRRYDAAGLRTRSIAFEHAFEWTSEEAINTSLVPPTALQLLAAHLEDAYA